MYDSVYPLKRGDGKRPLGEYPREKVAIYLSTRVEKVDRRLVPWCTYIAEQCPFVVWEDGEAGFPDDWLDVHDFAMEWQEKEEEVVPVLQEPVVEETEMQYCGKVTVRPEGELIIKIGERCYYEATEDHPFDLKFAQRYMQDLKEHSLAIHPMQLDKDARVTDQGWMFKRRRLDAAREILTALKRNTDLPLYIPGDGVGFFSLAARELGMKYFSTEPAKCGELAIKMGLISCAAAYTSYHGEGHVLVASQLMPFVPEILAHNGPRVIFDQQRWYASHPKELKIIPSTGHRVCATSTLLRGYQPLVLLEKGFSPSELSYIVTKAEDYDGHIISEDKAMISKCMLAGLTVASRSYAGYGPVGWIQTVVEERQYLQLGRGPGCVDPLMQIDVNIIRYGTHGQMAPIYYGREGVKVFSPYHGQHAVPFKPIMTWVSPTEFYELKGMYRQRVRFRARLWPIPGKGEVLAIRTRGLTEPVIAVQYGLRMYSAEVDERARIEVSGWIIAPIRLGAVVGQVQDIKKLRSLPSNVVAKLIQNDRWFSEAEFRSMTPTEVIHAALTGGA